MTEKIPTESECFEIMAELDIPTPIVHHSVAVKNVALGLAEQLEAKGMIINKPLITAAALLHDMLKLDAEMCHCIEAGDKLRDMGYPAVASVVEKHGLNNLNKPELVPTTNEEKLLMYSDLRVCKGKMVSLEERFKYIRERYKPKNMEKFNSYLEFVKKMEKEFIGVQ